MSKLTILNLSNNPLSTVSLVPLLENLKQLDLKSTKLASLDEIGKFNILPSLNNVDLSDSPILAELADS